MKNWFIYFCLLMTTTLPAQIRIGSYHITVGKIAGWSMVAAGGAADGLLEGYTHDNRTSLERKYGVSRYSWGGSESWRKVYNNFDPAQGFKSPAHEFVGAWDFAHNMDDGRKLGYIGGSITIGLFGAKTNTKWWHYALDFGISWGLSAGSKAAAYHWIRS